MDYDTIFINIATTNCCKNNKANCCIKVKHEVIITTKHNLIVYNNRKHTNNLLN